jgi:hypothetical protein
MVEHSFEFHRKDLGSTPSASSNLSILVLRPCPLARSSMQRSHDRSNFCEFVAKCHCARFDSEGSRGRIKSRTRESRMRSGSMSLHNTYPSSPTTIFTWHNHSHTLASSAQTLPTQAPNTPPSATSLPRKAPLITTLPAPLALAKA